MIDKDFLLQTYGETYGAECGPWNLSVENKYLEYRFAAFFEENFSVAEGADICNVGIGAGHWDRYLTYRLRGGSLTSIDKDALACRQLREGLCNEGNPHRVRVIHSDVMQVTDCDGRFDIVTMVGTTRIESGLFEPILEKVFRFVKPGGSLYYQSLDETEQKEDVLSLCEKHNMRVENWLMDNGYGFRAQYWKISKQHD